MIAMIKGKCFKYFFILQR